MCQCGNKVSDPRLEELQQIIDNSRETSGMLIALLQETQELFGYLPGDAIKLISDELKVPSSEIYGVATFYSQFRLKPRGRNVIRVCTGTACHVRGGDKLVAAVTQALHLGKGENTTRDLMFTFEPVACLGACGMAPVMMVNDDAYGRVTPEEVPAIIARYVEEEKACIA